MFIRSKTTLALAALVALLTALTAIGQAKADDIGNTAFAQTVEMLNQNPQSVQIETVFDKNCAQSILSKDDILQMTNVAKSQTEIWGDTILEGVYEADGQTEVDRVDALMVNARLVAYRVVYSQRAWDTSTCTYTDLASLAHCQDGRIEEASFVSTNLTSWTHDPKQLAVFLAKSSH